MVRLRRAIMAALSAGALMSSALAVGGTVAAQSAPPGGDAQYQVEISYNCTGPSCPLPAAVQAGAGVWLWLELDQGGGGIYDGSDCIHGVPFAPNGAISDQGTLSWTTDGTDLIISGVQLAGYPTATIITVPEGYGHYIEQGPQVFSQIAGASPPPGTTQVEVAP